MFPFGIILALFVLFVLALPVFTAVSLLNAIARIMQRLHLRRRLRPMLESAARTLELPPVKQSSLLHVAVDGKRDGYALSIALDAGVRHGQHSALRFTVTAPRALPRNFLITTRDHRLSNALGEPTFRTYDRDFDRWFVVYGRSVDVATRLDPKLRERLYLLTADGSITVQENRITLIAAQPVMFAPSIVRISERLLELARELFDDQMAPEAHLHANALTETHPAARYRALELLMTEHAGTREADDALNIAWDAPERGIKILAAMRRGEAGLPFIEETAELRSEPVNLRVIALRHLVRHAPAERALAVLRRLLKQSREEVLRTVVELIGRLQDRESLPVLVTIGRRQASDVWLRASVAHAVGQIGDRAGESYLLEELHAMSIEVRLAAVQALGRAGTPHALGMLQRVAARSFAMRDLSLAARSAIARIEARCGAGERGRLSLAEQTELGGALSFQKEEGALSVAFKDDA